MTEKAITTYKQGDIIPKGKGEIININLAETMELGQVLADSGMFPDCKSKAQAVAKILLGRELGLTPVYSLQKIYVVQGRLNIGYELVAALVNMSEHYRYTVDETTDMQCKITFLRDGKPIGISQFTIQDAQKAGLVKPDSNWMKWPDVMLFARTITQGAKKYCPEILAGTETLEDSVRELSLRGEVTKAGEPPASAWQQFWGAARKKGFTEDEEIHKALKVASMKEWLAEGKTLEQAIDALPNLRAQRDAEDLYRQTAKPAVVKSEPPTTVNKQVESQTEGKAGQKTYPKVTPDRVDQLSRALTAAGYLPGELREALFNGMKIIKLADLDTNQGNLLEAFCKRKEAEKGMKLPFEE